MAARDTSPAAEELQFELHRQFTPGNRLAMAIEMSEFARKLSRVGLRNRHPELTEAELDQAMLFQLYGFRSQFNVIDYATGWKVDFIIPSFDEFNVEEFERRRNIDFEGITLSVISPEDIVIAKLLWAKAGDSDLQIRDVATVLRSQSGQLDMTYVEKWVHRLGLIEQMRKAQASAG